MTVEYHVHATEENSKATIRLGNRASLAELFSYPNHSAKNDDPSKAWSLEETIEHYLMSSILRDGFAESKIEVTTMSQTSSPAHVEEEELYCSISGSAAIPFSDAIPKFLSIGNLGLQACQQLQADGLWRDSWRFFLPLGLPLVEHVTLELLHFPPIYTLEEDQDYLASRSIQRWKQLLTANLDKMNDTGKKVDHDQVIPEDSRVDSTDRFQAIVDIVPIAAPSSDGKNMKEVYPYFEKYVRASLEFWTSSGCRTDGKDALQSIQQLAKPFVAFGWPVKCWVESNQFATTTENDPLGVLSVTRMPIGTVEQATSAPVLIANHPSYLYNAGRRMSSNTIESVGVEDRALLEKIMTQDLIAAMWQVRMGLDSWQDPHGLLDECCHFWKDASRLQHVHEMINAQAFILQES